MEKEYNEERTALCALNRIMGFEPIKAHALIESAGSAKAVFGMDDREIRLALGPSVKYKYSFSREELDKAAEELSTLDKYGGRFIGMDEESYPSALRECPDCPLGIYMRGAAPQSDSLNSRQCIAIVGTRDVSQYGAYWCREIVRAIASCQSKPVIVSGLAIGTDIIAHREAMDCGLSTVAVMATGIETIYPTVHRKDAERIISTAGCLLLSDYHTSSRLSRINFLRRNRIIAGLCSSVIIIESGLKGGSLITADFAYQYLRNIYALPGRIDDPRSRGCNTLIREKKAESISSMASLIRDLGIGKAGTGRRECVERMTRERCSDCTDIEELVRIALAVKGRQGITIDELCRDLGLGVSQTAVSIEMLESRNIIEVDLIGRCYISNARIIV